jgi:hypothetical protein
VERTAAPSFCTCRWRDSAIGRATSKWAGPMDQCAWALPPCHRHRHNSDMENAQRYGHAAGGGVGNRHAGNARKCWCACGTQRRSTVLTCHVMAVQNPAAARRAVRKACNTACGPTWSVRRAGSSSSLNTKQTAVLSHRCLPSRIDHRRTLHFRHVQHLLPDAEAIARCRQAGAYVAAAPPCGE